MRRMTDDERQAIDRSLADWILDQPVPNGVDKMEWLANLAHYCLMATVSATLMARAEGDDSFITPENARRIAERAKEALIDEAQSAFRDHQRRN